MSDEDPSTYLRRRLTGDLEAIVNGFLEEAKKGSVAHMKLTMELLASPKEQTVQRPTESSTLQKLLDRMGDE